LGGVFLLERARVFKVFPRIHLLTANSLISRRFCLELQKFLIFVLLRIGVLIQGAETLQYFPALTTATSR